MTRLARSPLLALAVAIAVCWFVGQCPPDVRMRPDACMPLPGIPAELLGYHGAGTPHRPEDSPWIVRETAPATPGDCREGVDDPGNCRRPGRSLGVWGRRGRDPVAPTPSPVATRAGTPASPRS
jgi:hypothetical protein